MLPLLKPLKMYKNDMVYQQKDKAEEIFFILRGQVLMYIDLNDPEGSQLENKDENRDAGAFEVPFNMYIQGSYFGDSDFFDKD